MLVVQLDRAHEVQRGARNMAPLPEQQRELARDGGVGSELERALEAHDRGVRALAVALQASQLQKAGRILRVFQQIAHQPRCGQSSQSLGRGLRDRQLQVVQGCSP